MTNQPARILVTGSRDWSDEELIASVLQPYLVAARSQQVILVHGACPTGADAIASKVWKAGGGVEERHPADWSRGRGGGPQRNAHMVALGASVCLAFIGQCTSPRCHLVGGHDSHGATGCADLAEAAGIPTYCFRDVQEVSAR